MSSEKPDASGNWKTSFLIVGGVIGALVGVIAARLYSQADAVALERDQQRKPQGLQLSPLTALPMVLSLIQLLRQISALSKNDQS